MIVRRIIETTLSQCAYFIACPRTRQAILVDPVRDPARYEAIAQELGVTPMAVLETHAPSDYVSGICEMLSAHSVNAFISGETDPPDWYVRDIDRWKRRVTFLKDGTSFSVGDLCVRAMLTPGHAAGAMSIEIEHAPSGVRVVLTGDALLPGGAGRTTIKDSQALQASLRRLAQLPDETIVLAGHSGGSACGHAVDLPGETTLGIERRFNRVFKALDSDAAFIAATCDNQPERPAYFTQIEELNHRGHAALLRELPPTPELTGDQFLQLISFPRTVVVDTRPWNLFTHDGADGALHAPLDQQFAPLVAAAVRPDERVVCVCEQSKIADIARVLHLIGIDRIDGWISSSDYGRLDHEILSLGDVDDISQQAAHTLYTAGECLMLDVRTVAEWLRGRIAGARLMTMSQLAEQVHALPRDRQVVVYCRRGSRSARACAFLRRRGFRSSTLLGGYWPWLGRGFPVEGVAQPVTESVG
ncbi:MAG: MBL fold metallo-hydrolase [Phycisphaerales bacterium]|nr:MBL fold metallo-hydrolase [Phycisphaerales bacterium]